MSKALDSGKTFLDNILAKLPENLREAAKTAFAAPEATDALTVLGDGVLARSDYSRQMDAIKEAQEKLDADYARLDKWYQDQKPKLDAYDTLKADYDKLKTGGAPPPAPTNEPPKTGLTREDVDALLAERERGYAGVIGLTNTLTAKHLKDFNEVLDMSELIAYAEKHKVPLYNPRADTDAYRAIHGEKLTARAKAEEDARINKQVEERLNEERKKFATQPFPLRNQAPSVLDVLENPNDKPTNHNLDSAVAEYERLQAARG